MRERIINLTKAGCTDQKISEITGLSVKKIREVNHQVRAEIYMQKVENAKRLRKEGKTHRQIATIMNISAGTAFYYTDGTQRKTTLADMQTFKNEWNAVCRRINPKAWEGRNDD